MLNPSTRLDGVESARVEETPVVDGTDQDTEVNEIEGVVWVGPF